MTRKLLVAARFAIAAATPYGRAIAGDLNDVTSTDRGHGIATASLSVIGVMRLEATILSDDSLMRVRLANTHTGVRRCGTPSSLHVIEGAHRARFSCIERTSLEYRR